MKKFSEYMEAIKEDLARQESLNESIIEKIKKKIEKGEKVTIDRVGAMGEIVSVSDSSSGLAGFSIKSPKGKRFLPVTQDLLKDIYLKGNVVKSKEQERFLKENK